MQKSLCYTRLYNLQSKVQALISRTRKHCTYVCVQDDITSLSIVGFRQNATLLTTITVIRLNFKMSDTDSDAKGNCCAHQDIWIAISPYFVFLSTILCSTLIWCIRKLERKDLDDWMERIKQTYILLIPRWLSDCEYVMSHRGTSNECATNTNSMTVTNDNELVEALHTVYTEKRVLFVGEPGIGKSHLFRSIARKWANGKILKGVILIYLQLDQVPREACILKEFLKMLKRENAEKEINSLIDTLQYTKSIVMLDGLSNWSRYCNTTSNNANRNKNDLTLEELLEPNKKRFQNMAVWVTSRNVEADMNVIKGNYTEVKLNGLNEKHRKNFFQKFLEMENCGNKIWNFFSKKWQRHSKRKLIDNWDNYITKTCSNLLITRYPVIVRYLATMYCSDNQTIDETYFRDFPMMIKTTTDLMELKKVDLDLLVCLLEVGSKDDDIYRACAMMLHLKKLVFNHMKDEYFHEAKLRLLKTLKEKKVAITSLTIYGYCPIKLLSCLPEIEQRLVIYNVRFTKIDFLDVIKSISHQELILEFYNSKVPETIPVNELLDQCSTTKLPVIRYQANEDSYQLCWTEGVWKNVETEIGHRQSVEENRPKEQNSEQKGSFSSSNNNS